MSQFIKGPWKEPRAYSSVQRNWRGTVVAIIAGAIAVGIGAGYLLEAGRTDLSGKPNAPIEWSAVQAVPTRTPDAEDIAWPKRAEDLDAGSSFSEPASASFGYCYSGGGANCVVDGDTFYMNGETVRIADLDAPETHPPRCDYEARLGEQATRMLHDLLNSGRVTMTSIDRERDIYGRLLRNVQVDGADVGETMVSAGVAREYGSGRKPWC